MKSKFMPPPIKRLSLQNIWSKIKKKSWWGSWFYCIVLPLIPYERHPGEPAEALPEKTGNIADEQLAQCQEIYKESEARGAQIERKAQWTFTVIAFLIPAFSTAATFLLQNPRCEIGNHSSSLTLLLISAFLLVLSIISALRGMTVRNRESLFIHAVIGKETGKFVKYRKTHYAQGLLYCSMRNTVIDNHRAELVKSAHILLIISIVFFISGMLVLVI